MRITRNTKDKGNLSEAKAIARFIELGWAVLLPFGDNEPYDIVIDRGQDFERVQVKTARSCGNGSIEFSNVMLLPSNNQRNVLPVSYKGLVDLFVAYYPILDRLYLMSIDEVTGSRKTYLRIDPPLNKQNIGVRWAKDYLL